MWSQAHSPCDIDVADVILPTRPTRVRFIVMAATVIPAARFVLGGVPAPSSVDEAPVLMSH